MSVETRRKLAEHFKNLGQMDHPYVKEFYPPNEQEPKKEAIIHIVKRNNVPLVFITKKLNNTIPVFTKDAREILMRLPSGRAYFAIKYAKQYAQEKGYKKVTKATIVEQLEEMDLIIDEGITELQALCPRN